MVILSVLPFFVFAQVTIPRAGFPYCQPFTGSGNPNDLPFTIAKGNTVDYSTSPPSLSPDRNLILTGNALQLTPSSQNERGYILIDLPFLSEYGIKTSFEYFVHTPGGSGLGDGLSFFLIDGSVSESAFQIGGLGGSLGYAPHGSNGGSYSTSGVTGGYMGIGFDMLGNFGNYQEKKYGGFDNPNQFNFSTPNPDIKFYPNAITIRGPLNAGDPTRRNGSPPANATNIPLDSYQFVDGKVTHYDPTPGAYGGLQGRVDNGSGALFASSPSKFLSEMFKIGADLRPEDVNCGVALPPGYRKVYIDLEPTGNPMSPYRIKVDMLVGNNPTPINIFNNLLYTNKPAPATLKVGFAASTGSGYFSTSEIRNVAVQVSSVEDAVKPVPPPLFREVCIDEDNTVDFPFCVELPSSSTAFIQCIQLYQADPGPGDNDFASDTYECGLSGYCTLRCNDTFKRLDALDAFGNKVGEFIAELDDEVEVGKFNQAKITYIRTNPAFFGTVTAWYKIVDNFGLESDGTPITITINPLPEIVSTGTVVNMSCDGQNDGEINGIVIRNLVPAPDKYTVQFLDASGNTITPVLVSEVIQSDGYITATFDLKNLNLGTYRVLAINPSSESLGNVCSDGFDNVTADDCEEEFILHTLSLEQGTPVELDPYKDEICEGEVFEVTPTIDPKYNPNNLPVPFKWYLDENRTQPLNDGVPATVDGVPVTVSVSPSGELNLTGLKANGINPKTYTFYVETLFKDNSGAGSGNFCPFVGDVTTVATVTVYPELVTSFTVAPDWCRATSGSIQVNAQGGTGPKTYNLYLIGNASPIASQVTASNSHSFNGLLPGDYEVEIFTQNPTCTKLLTPITVEGPTVPLTLTAGSTVNAYCNSPNGSLEFSLLGGNPVYTITLDGNPLPSATTISGNNYSIPGLAAGSYTVAVTDSKTCVQSINIVVAGDPLSQFGTTNDEICEGEVATVFPTVITQSTSAPVFKWFYKDGAGAYVEITNGLNLSGTTFAINGANELSVSNLAPQATPYTYYLNVTGTKVCDQGYIPAEILVNPKPVLSAPTITQVTCNGAADGVIQAQLLSGNLGDFEFSLTGNNGVNRPFASNSGLFNALPPGTYVLTVKSSKGCETSVGNLIITEPTPLLVSQVSKTDATCNLPNGEIRFAVSGATPDGTGKYGIKVNGADITSFGTNLVQNGPADFTLLNLAPGNYQIEAEDSNACKNALTITLLDTEVPAFDAQDVTVCEGTDAVLTPEVVSNTIGAIPVYAWSYENPALPGQFIPINNGDIINDAAHTLSNGVLTIKGLKFDAASTKYYLTVSGDKVCPADPIEVEVRVLKIPTAAFQTTPVSCFGGTDGQINLTSVDPADPNTFTLVETGASNATGNFSNLEAGTYTVRIKETGSPCESEFKVEVTEPLQLELLNPLKSDPTCNEINGSISFDVNGGTKDYQILINGKPIADYSFGQTGDRYELKNLPPGTYGVQVTDANSCVVNQPNLFVLVNDNGLTVSINPLEEEKCVGSPAVLNPVFTAALPVTPTLKWYKDAGLVQPITSSPTPDAENITYQINSTGILTISGLKEGEYKYYLEVSGPGICTLVEEANVKIVPQILADIVVDNITCFGLIDGSISVTPSGGNGNFEIRLNGGTYSANTVYPNLAPGNYSVDIRNDIGCVTSYQVEVKAPAGPISINNPSIIRASCDLDNGSIEDLVISGGWNAYTVEWRLGSVTGTLIPGDVTGAKNLAPGTYFLIVSDVEGCQATFSFVIEESSDPVYAVVPPINSCTGSPVLIRPIHIAPNPSLPPAAATEVRWYTEPNQAGLIQNGPDSSFPSVVYTIDDSDWLNPELQIDGLPAGVYDYYFYVVCTGQEIKVDVTVFDTPEVSLETDAITCFGDTNGKVRILSGQLPSYTYKVNGGPALSQAAFEALTLAAGTYSLEVATPAGCSQNLNFTIEGPSAPLVISTLTKIDPGCGAPNGKLIFTVTGGYSPYTIDVIKDGQSQGTQNSSQSNFQLDGYRPGVYQINITDREACSVSSNTVTLVDGPTQILIPQEAICAGDVAVVLPTLDPSAPGATFQWYFDSGKTQPIVSSPTPATDGRIYQINSTTGELSISNLPESATPYNYYVTASGAGICPGFTGIGIVGVYGIPTATSQVTNEVCFGTGGSITVSATGGSGTYSYSLNGGQFGSTNVFQVPTGVYSITVRTPEGCSTVLSGIQVTGPTSALSATGFQQNNPSCELDNGSIEFSIAGGYPPYTVNYTRSGVSAGSITIADPGVVSIGSLQAGTYSFAILDDQGCALNVPTTLNLVEVPTVITVQDDAICVGETAILEPSLPSNISNPSYTWSFDAAGSNPIASGTSGGATFNLNPNGTLTVTGLSSAGSPYTYYVMASGVGVCGISPKPVKVTVNEIPGLRVSNPSVVCDPTGTVDLTLYIEGFNPAVYDYSVLSPTGSAMQLGELSDVAVSGDYRVSSSVKGQGCWNQPQRIRVIIADEELIADFQYEVDLGNGTILTNSEIQIQEDVQFVDLSLGNTLIWNWDFGDGLQSGEQNPVHQYQTKGTYTVRLEAIDEFGCVSVYERVVNVFDDYNVMIPNAFTPDGSKNQFFKPYYRGIASMDFYIFNTWGELIFHSDSLEDRGWDGTLNGKHAPNGNYVYKGRFVSRSGEVVEKSGVFILIR